MSLRGDLLALAATGVAAALVGPGCAEATSVPLTARPPTPLLGPLPTFGMLGEGGGIAPILRARAPITLVRVLDLAGDAPNLVRLARTKLAEVDAGLHERQADVLLPTLQIVNEFEVHQGAIEMQQSSAFATTGRRDFLGLRILKDWDVFGGYEELSARTLERDAEREELGSVKLTSYEDGALGYFDLEQAQADVAIAREALARAEEFLAVATAREQEKLGLTVDRLQAESEVAKRAEAAVAAEEAFRVASATLATFLRLDPTVLFFSDEAAVRPITFVPPDTDVDVLIRSAYETRPDLREARDRIRAQEHELTGAQIGPFLPHVVLGLDGHNGGLGLEFPGARFGEPKGRADYYVGLRWDVVGGGAADYFHARLDAARVATATVQAQDRSEHVARQIIEAHEAVRSRYLAIEAARHQVTASEEAWNIALKRLKEGVGLAVDVLAANEARTTAQTRLVDAITLYNKNQFKLLARMGEKPDVRDFVGARAPTR
jgi:outer membrane protein TolC